MYIGIFLFFCFEDVILDLRGGSGFYRVFLQFVSQCL